MFGVDETRGRGRGLMCAEVIRLAAYAAAMRLSAKVIARGSNGLDCAVMQRILHDVLLIAARSFFGRECHTSDALVQQ